MSVHRLFQHVTALQQSALVAQAWPYSAHTAVGPSTALGPSTGPAPPSTGGDPGGGGRVPHTPWVEPTCSMHTEPTQQSALIVHGPPAGTHADGTPPSMPEMGGTKQRRTPEASGTQGAWLQQSTADEQVSPA